MEFSTMCTSFKGEAGLLFCGVEMSVEKGFYLITLIGYLNSVILAQNKDPYADGDGGGDDDYDNDGSSGGRRLIHLTGDLTQLGGLHQYY